MRNRIAVALFVLESSLVLFPRQLALTCATYDSGKDYLRKDGMRMWTLL
jgi:hypothetical protein